MKLKQGRPVEHNWKALLKEYEAEPDLNLREWCEKKDINYTGASREFTAIQKEEAQSLLERTQRILAKSLPKMAEGLIALSTDDDKNIQLKAISTAMDRAGLSVQAINVQVNNTANINILAVPIFANAYADKLDDFLGAKIIDADKSSDS